MTYHFNVSGAERKALVSKISELLSTPAKYMGMPSMAYQIGEYEVSKDGTLSCPYNPEQLESTTVLVEALEDAGFKTEEPTGLTITIPLNMVDAGKLTNLLDAKGALIKAALGIPATPIVITEDTISFPWFETLPTDEEIAAYSKFIDALCAMSKNQKRINATEKTVDNEKYAFRCFLLRLGFIGDEYKKERKILLSRLSGSSAFKGGASHAISE